MTEPTPQQQMNKMLTGYWVSQAIYVVAKLQLADLLRDGPRTADELANLTKTDRPSLYRLLRALAGVGVFAEDDQHRFSLTPLGACLRRDIPGSQRAMAVMMGEEHYYAWGDLLYSVRTGKTAFDRIYGMPIFEYLAENPDQAKNFDAAMLSIHGRETRPMIEAYDFSSVKVLADIGGGNGSVLLAILQAHPHMHGILYDLPNVAERAKANVQSADLHDRCKVISGSFFETIPSGADTYIMRHIIHDWNDDQCHTILQNIHRVLPDDGCLLVVESVIPQDNEPSFAKLLDLTMMVIPGGRERTEDEFRDLYEKAGFEMTRIVPTNADVSLIEGRKR